jgi:DNA-binding MarR family transcriptional regulator
VAVATRQKQAGSDGELTDFAEAWDEFFGAVRRARGRAATAPGGLTLSQFQLLDALDRGAARTAGELAVAAPVTPPTASRMLDLLEREGIIERSRDEADRRVVSISLTEEGRRRVKLRRSKIAKRRKMVFEALSAEERRRGAELLRRLAEAIDEPL